MKRPRVLHPFLLAIFPVLFLFAQNQKELQPGVIVIPLAVVLGFVIVTYFLLSALWIRGTKAGIVVSVFLILWFSYGRVVAGGERLLKSRNIFGGGDLVVLLFVYFVWSLLFVRTLYWIRKPEKEFYNVTKFLNVLGGSLICVTLIQIALSGVRSRHTVSPDSFRAPMSNLGRPEIPQSRPDIYYFILDGYGRADVLRRVFNYDNRSFLNSLTRRGFFVAEESRSNYVQTGLSLASSLNMDYLDELLTITPERDDRRPLEQLILSSRVVAFLKERGYRTISFPSGYSISDLKTADSFLTEGAGLNQFQSVLIDTTPLPELLPGLDLFSSVPGLGMHLRNLRYFDPYESKRRRVLYALGKTPELAKAKGPKFVFVHVLVPHPPFVFGKSGEPRRPNQPFSFDDGDAFMRHASEREYADGYTEQLEFTNTMVLQMVDRLLAASPHPPVIILQSDHGSGLGLEWEDPEVTDLPERLSILNAYYFPGGEGGLYEAITPVNTFRVVFNQYFGADFELLPDRSYFSTWSHPYKFIDVTSKTSPLATGSPSSPLQK